MDPGADTDGVLDRYEGHILGYATADGRRVVVGIGHESTGQECDLTSRALATGLGVEPVVFPGDHTGFVDHPVAFAAQIHRVLDGR